MERRLYVGNLPYTVDEPELRAVFEQLGRVRSVAVIRERDTQRSRGFGFVEYEAEDAATVAREKLNGFDLHGRALRVNGAVDPRQGQAARAAQAVRQEVQPSS